MTALDLPNTLTPGPALERLLSLMGVAGHYIDYSGATIPIPLDNRLNILAAMGICVGDDQAVEQALHDLNQRLAARLVPPAAVCPAGQPHELSLHQPLDLPDGALRWRITREDGTVIEHQADATGLPEAGPQAETPDGISLRRLPLPPLPAGYHQLSVTAAGRTASCRLIAAPPRCHEPDWLRDNQRLAGLSVQLYSLRSDRNWGMGDFTDLDNLLRQAAAAGVDFVVLNPLHVLDSLWPERCSPYSPLDRRFLNPLYIDVEREPDFLDCRSARDYVARPAFGERLAELRRETLVDYGSVARLKMVALSKMFRHFSRQHLEADTPRAREFLRWEAEKGQPLQDFAGFEAQRHRLTLDQSRHARFHCYLQWLTESQLEASQQLALTSGMRVGLVRDLAVGGNAGSAEVQLNPGLFRTGASIGAPPDHLAPQGQNWGLPPMDPNALRESGFAHFIELLRDNLSHCGGLRIDHVMSLLRLWWCPEAQGEAAKGAEGRTGSRAGAYVFYPVDELFAILRLESQRRGCLVIGEDLGVVPPEIRQHMSQSAVLSNVLFYFEKYDPVQFRKPEHYPPRALAMVANHDVPTLAAWWNKVDLELRQRIGLLNDAQERAQAIGQRESDLIQILHWLDSQGALPDTWRDFNIHRPFDSLLCAAIQTVCGRSPSQLVSLQLEDL